MVEKAKAPEHKIKTSLLEYDEVKNYYKDDDNNNYKPIYLNVNMEDIKTNIKNIVIVYVCIQETFIILTMYLKNLYQLLIHSQRLRNAIKQI